MYFVFLLKNLIYNVRYVFTSEYWMVNMVYRICDIISIIDEFCIFLLQCWIAFDNCCGEVMRGPSSSPKTAEEEAEISTGLTDAIRGNESVNRHVSCSRTGSNSSSKVIIKNSFVHIGNQIIIAVMLDVFL